MILLTQVASNLTFFAMHSKLCVCDDLCDCATPAVLFATGLPAQSRLLALFALLRRDRRKRNRCAIVRMLRFLAVLAHDKTQNYGPLMVVSC